MLGEGRVCLPLYLSVTKRTQGVVNVEKCIQKSSLNQTLLFTNASRQFDFKIVKLLVTKNLKYAAYQCIISANNSVTTLYTVNKSVWIYNL